MRAARTAWMLDGSAPSSAPIATSCSRNSGLPSARRTIPAAPGASRTSSSASPCRQRLQGDDGAARARREPPRAHLDELGAPEAQHQDRMGAGERSDVVEEVQERRLGPVDVVDREHERAAGGDALEQPPHRPERLVGLHRRAVAEADGAQHRARERLVAVEQRGDPGRGLLPADLAHDLRERTVGDVLAVGQAAPDRDRRVVADVVQHLPDQARLADARGPGHRHGHERAAPRGAAIRVAQRGELLVPADERARRRRVLRAQPQQTRRRVARHRATAPADRPRARQTRASRSAIRVPARISPSAAAACSAPAGRTAPRSPGGRPRRRTPRLRRARRGPAPGRGSRVRPARRAARRPRAAR